MAIDSSCAPRQRLAHSLLWLGVCLILGLGVSLPGLAAAGEPADTPSDRWPAESRPSDRNTENLVEVTVAEPLMELRTGPGRGYPVFYVAERGETVLVLKRRTSWFKVRTERQAEGWVSRQQMEGAVMAEGVQQSLRDAVLEDFQHRRIEAGFDFGLFKRDPVVGFHVGYSLTDNLIAELSLSQVAGTYSGSRLVTGSLMLQPSADWRVMPYFAIGTGLFQNRNRASLIGNTTTLDSSINFAGVGLRTYLTRNLILRLDYRQYLSLTSVQQNNRFDEELVGLSFFF